MKASDIAYLAALVERAPSCRDASGEDRRRLLLAELQDIYRATQGRRYGTNTLRVPVMPSFATMDIERS